MNRESHQLNPTFTIFGNFCLKNIFISRNILPSRPDLSRAVLDDDPTEGGDGAGDELQVGPVLGRPLNSQGSLSLVQLQRGSSLIGRTYIQHSHWSSSYIAALSLVESFRVVKYFHALKGPIIGVLSDATPAV